MSRPPLRYRIADFFHRLFGWFGETWNRLIEPVELFLGRLGERFFDAFDSFQGLEAAVVGLVRALFWPLIALGRLFGRWMPETGGGPLGWLGKAVQALIGGVMRVAEKLNLDGVIFFFVWLLTPIWRPVAGVLGFANAWLATRRPRELALAVPALLLAAPFAYVAYAGARQSHGDVAERYKVAVREALQDGDHDLAGLLERKLAQMGVDTRRGDYRNAEAIAKDGNLKTAYERMSRLAPAESTGYGPAHGWIAQHLLSGDLSEKEEPLLADSAQRLVLAEQHLDRLAELGPTGVGGAMLRAFVYSRTDRVPEAIDKLERFSDDSFDAAAMRLRLLASEKRTDEARSQAANLLALYERRAGGARLDVSAHQAAALAAELTRQEPVLATSLKAWAEAAPEDRRPVEWLDLLRRRQFERMFAERTSNPTAVAARLTEAASLGASREWMREQIQKINDRRVRDRNARRVWETLLVSPDAPTELLMQAGAQAAAQGQIPLARGVFRRLIDRGVESGVVWNNYAWTLLQDPDPDPVAALESADRAVATNPRDYRFRETRGQAHVLLGAWDEALADLEYALNGMPESEEVHSSLAVVYDALAQPQLAKMHRREAAR